MTLQVIRSGRNIDEEVLAELMKGNYSEEILLAATPEVLSAAYARISRDPRPVDELRADARKEVEKARKSTENIIFTMGHHSVAEHAVLSFDVMGLSRLAVEALEQHRLCSYTEKSQRYITLKGDYVVPDEIKGEPIETEFRNLVENVQNEFYFEHLETLEQWHTQNPGSEALLQRMKVVPEKFKTREAYEARKKATIEGWAKEDARYALSLATEAQLGFTTNARNLEYIIRKFKYHPLAEVRELGAKLYASAREVIPSLIILADEEEFQKTQKATLNDDFFKHEIANRLTAKQMILPLDRQEKGYQLLIQANDADKEIISALIVNQRGIPLPAAYRLYEIISPETKIKYIKACLKHLSEYDSPPREFEMGEFTFDAVMSASCYAQFKRHRMCTQLPGSYSLGLIVMIPASIKGIGREQEFFEVMERSAELYEKIREAGETGKVADYCLTNAHQRRVVAKINLRELYHFSRLREDAHAQWEIRELANAMCEEARRVAPATTILLGGKDEFPKIREEVYRKREEE